MKKSFWKSNFLLHWILRLKRFCFSAENIRFESKLHSAVVQPLDDVNPGEFTKIFIQISQRWIIEKQDLIICFKSSLNLSLNSGIFPLKITQSIGSLGYTSPDHSPSLMINQQNYFEILQQIIDLPSSAYWHLKYWSVTSILWL